MQLKDYAKWYLRSPLGIGGIFAGALGAAALLIAGVSPFWALPAGLALAALSGGLALVFGLGPKQAVAEREGAMALANRERIAQTLRTREALACTRIADEKVAAAVQLVVLTAGEYIEACKKESSDDPIADAALADAKEIVDIFLKEKDEASTEKRFGLEDQDPFADARERVVAALKEKALVLRERRIQIDGGLSAADKMSVREEIE